MRAESELAWSLWLIDGSFADDTLRATLVLGIAVGKTKTKTVVRRLKDVTPQEFENLTYDLLFLSGMRNLRWRTPGADGGRDLEGDFSIVDLAGETTVQRWYIECKRYAKAINWPTVHEKLSVAENHRADFLLFVTTSNFSSPCRDEADRHNTRGGSVKIRIWPFYQLDQLLSVHGQLAVKYGLRTTSAPLPVDFETIVTEITKLAQSTYAAAIFGRPMIGRSELLAAFSELLAARMADARKFGSFVPSKFKPARDSFDWCDPTPLPATEFDQTSLRAALSCIRTITGQDRLTCEVRDKKITIAPVQGVGMLESSKLFALIDTFGLLNVSLGPTSVILEARSYD